MKKISLLKAIFIFLAILCVFSSCVLFLENLYFQNKKKEILQDTENILQSVEVTENKKEQIFKDECIGILKIPSIDIQGLIYEGTTKEVLKYWIGHFEETPIWRAEMLLLHLIMKAHMLTIFQVLMNLKMVKK